jgi:putative addiction module antidote
MNENATPKPTTVLKVTRIGDSLGLVLPPEVVERLGLKDGDQLSAVEQADGAMQFATISTQDRTMQAVRRVMDQYAETFRILAK